MSSLRLLCSFVSLKYLQIFFLILIFGFCLVAPLLVNIYGNLSYTLPKMYEYVSGYNRNSYDYDDYYDDEGYFDR